MQIYWTKINKIIDEAPEVKTYLLDCPEAFTWEEGSHTHFALQGFNAGDKPNRGLVRHMSISTITDEGAIGITTRMKAQCSEFKSILKGLQVGDEVALFKTHTNVPLQRTGKKIYLLSSGVGLATFRPLVLNYLNNIDQVSHVHSLNIDSTKHFLFTNIFNSDPRKNFTAQFVDNRTDYYKEVEQLAADQDGLFYIVGSDDFLVQNIKLLREHGITTDQIAIDKHESQIMSFLSNDLQ
ncbi:ferredoxin--NADP+ reductase [Amphibacillus marinus]|uniref:Ferredoxin--NADP+ reductase n=1 Tax=Amphibacillus marinus TaxID=872970 RepID=A0A1H8LKJ0_9BACI|nr:dihydropteridine reductase [Amphibacillus marinus]SEO05627.1 ferredoxin--NADP+ reductase [Amphibacillus marinus]